MPKPAAMPGGDVELEGSQAPPRTTTFPVVAIGASAGGLKACTELISALPTVTGMAFVLVQHLDPKHESMMADLLARHTSMTVEQAVDGTRLETEHLYIIPPGTYLSVQAGVLRLSDRDTQQGARLPFDFLLHSLAKDGGARAACVILSGTGADGSAGLANLKAKGGLVIAQDPKEAEYDGMPRSAILTGNVDAVLAVARIPAALASFAQHEESTAQETRKADSKPDMDDLSAIVELLHAKTVHDFRLYKPGTLQRRIERRMEIASPTIAAMSRYLEILRNSAEERDLLTNDLLINVTSFFRDPDVFDLLAKKVVPDLVLDQPLDEPFRIWIVGCSTGEEVYSLAILFLEAMAAADRNIKLQIFASDVDPDAIDGAREGLYPITIAADVSADRLARFFSKEERGYRVLPDLRVVVVFTVQDILTDPPFSRIHMISCRNLLIYLAPSAQAKVISLFHFALRQGGVLLLGNSETIGHIEGRFAPIAKPERIYRHVGRSRPGDLAFPFSVGEGIPILARAGAGQLPSRQPALANLCRKTVLKWHAPAAVLVNRRRECLYSLGATDRFLRVVSGYPSNDLLEMATPALRTKLRAAIDAAGKDKPRAVSSRSRIERTGGGSLWFSIDVQLVESDGEELLLVCFVEEPAQKRQRRQRKPDDSARVADLEGELEATRGELHAAVRLLETSGEEQRAINEEALSVNQEFQSTNEELLTSKEELQSLNEELNALNSQLQETLERQRITSDDLKNVLYSTNVATLFLDVDLKIRFFTPATRSLFNVIPGDVGRPLTDLRALTPDGKLAVDAAAVLDGVAMVEREIEAPTGVWFLRRILPYRSHDNAIEGLVITFTDITERKHTADALEAAKREAELANIAKSHFLAAASHDLRQPLQSLTLLQDLLSQSVKDEKPQQQIVRLGETLAAMSGMLNALLDINQIEAGVVEVEPNSFPINDLLDRLGDEFAYHAQARHLTLKILPCSLIVRSDPHLLEQMVRNLLANALKYTERGNVLVGCRRRAGLLRIEIWDTGIGIAEADLKSIFDEFHQIDNAARERSRGLGLGLSIVQRLGELLHHEVRVSSKLGHGSVFSVDVPLFEIGALPAKSLENADPADEPARHRGKIILIEDDPDVRDLLAQLLRAEGHSVTTATDGATALQLVSASAICPEIILADYNLPNGMDGLTVLAKLREVLNGSLPGILLTGDISAKTLGKIARHDCVQLSKPVKPQALLEAIERLMPPGRPRVESSGEITDGTATPVIFVIDDDDGVRSSLCDLLRDDGRTVEAFPTAEAFLTAYRQGRDACLMVDASLPGMSGITLLEQLRRTGDRLPTIVITGNSDVATAVQAMKAGASDFIEKPVGRADLLASIERALDQSRDITVLHEWQDTAARHIAGLTKRQRQIMDLVLVGHPSKNIAADLGISQRTVETHRAAIMRKTGAGSLPELARIALAAEQRTIS